MFDRPLWVARVQQAWTRRSIVWLSGVRRVGKTTLARMLPDAVYVNCDLPSAARATDDPELFLAAQTPDSIVALDEVQRLPDPSRLLKIAADTFPRLRILATGSSTLAATGKFRDTLAGRKVALPLFPVLWRECADPFGVPDFDRRLLHGGLPEPLLAARKDLAFFSEWIDSFYARDILELFGVRNRQGFLSLFRLLLRWSGGQVDYTKLARLSELSRPTVRSYLEALQVARAVHLLPPFRAGGPREIVSRPKCYAFDTGFVTFEKGWDTIREDDRGLLWEHLVLDELRARHPEDRIFYWRDKAQHEVDFVIRRARDRLDVVECKVSPDALEPAPVEAFRARYPEGENFIATPVASVPYRVRRGGRVFTVCATRDLP